MFNTHRRLCRWPAVDYGKIYNIDPRQRRVRTTTIKEYPGFISNKMLNRLTLKEMSVILVAWTTWLMVQQAWHESCVLESETTYLTEKIYYSTEHVILWQGHLANYATYGIWWVFETESEVDCGIKAWAVNKPNKMAANSIRLRVASNLKNTEENTL